MYLRLARRHDARITHIFETHRNEDLRDIAYTVFCGTGARATIGASKLKADGFEKVDVFLGSMKAWLSQDRPVQRDS